MSGWSNALKYAKTLAEKHGMVQAREINRVDAGLPLGAKIGSLIQIPTAVFVRAELNGSLLSLSGDENFEVKSVSSVKLGQPGELFRLYFATGDSDDREQFLQVFRDEEGTVDEIMICSRIARIIPESIEEQDAFTGQGGVGLGEKTYSLWREQMQSLGYGEAELARVFGASDSIEFSRDTGLVTEDFVQPYRGTEVRVDDADGVHGISQSIYFLPYVRELTGGVKEYLLISTEIVGSQDGDKSKRSIHVDFMIAVPVSKESVKVV